MSVLLEEALKLPVAERIRMADRLYESVGDPPGSTPLTYAQIAEIERRLAYNDKHPGETVSWEEIESRTLRRIGGNKLLPQIEPNRRWESLIFKT